MFGKCNYIQPSCTYILELFILITVMLLCVLSTLQSGKVLWGGVLAMMSLVNAHHWNFSSLTCQVSFFLINAHYTIKTWYICTVHSSSGKVRGNYKLLIFISCSGCLSGITCVFSHFYRLISFNVLCTRPRPCKEPIFDHWYLLLTAHAYSAHLLLTSC